MSTMSIIKKTSSSAGKPKILSPTSSEKKSPRSSPSPSPDTKKNNGKLPKVGKDGDEMGIKKEKKKIGAPVEEMKEITPPPRTLQEDDIIRLMYEQQRETDRITALEMENDTLKTVISELNVKIDKLIASRSQNVLHLQREMTKKEQRITELMSEKKTLQEQIVSINQQHTDEMKSVHGQHEEQISELEKRMACIQEKYAQLAKFKEEKSDLEQSLAMYKQSLEDEKREHTRNVSELERRNVMEKDRLKNEMLRKIRETKLSLLAMTEDQLHTTTKRTIMENEQMTTELQYQSRETERIVTRNNKLVAENKALRRQVELNEEAKVMLAKKTNFFHKLIKKLQAKIVEMEMHHLQQQQGRPSTTQRSRKSKHDDEHQQQHQQQQQQIHLPESGKDIQIHEMETRIHELEQIIQQIHVQQQEKVRERQAQEEEDEENNGENAVMELLTACLADVATTTSTEATESVSGRWSPSHGLPTDITSLTPSDRTRMLQLLLDRLHVHPQHELILNKHVIIDEDMEQEIQEDVEEEEQVQEITVSNADTS